MPILAPSPNSPSLPTVPASWRPGGKPGQILTKLPGAAAATPIARPATASLFYVRKTGSDTNGGSSSSLTPSSQGTDGVTNGTTTFTAASGTFTQADVNRLIMIGTKARYRITAVGSGTSITLSGSPSAGSTLTWKVGGAVQTIGALLGIANSPAGTILGGDTLYIGAGVYREVLNVASLTNTFEIQINGDVSGQFTGDPGQVQITAYTTDDKTSPVASVLLTINTASYLTFQNLVLVGSLANNTVTATAGTKNITFNDCAFLATIGSHIVMTALAATAANWTLARCYFGPTQTSDAVSITLNGSAVGGSTLDYDANILVTNCVFMGCGNARAFRVLSSNAGFGKGGGVYIYNCSFVCAGPTAIINAGTAISLAYPVVVKGCLIMGQNGIVASGVGMIIENYNLFYCNSARSSTTIGPASVSNNTYSPLFHFGQERIWGAMPRQWMEPMAGSPMLSFVAPRLLSTDMMQRPRPSGEYSAAAVSADSVGAFVRGNTAVTDASPIGAATSPFTLTGPSFEDFYVPVPAREVTVSCSVRYPGVPPALQVLPNPTIGVAGQIVTEPSGVPNVTHTVSLLPFTPTAAGNMVVIRVWNQDPSGSAVVHVDDFTVSG